MKCKHEQVFIVGEYPFNQAREMSDIILNEAVNDDYPVLVGSCLDCRKTLSGGFRDYVPSNKLYNNSFVIYTRMEVKDVNLRE